MKLKYRELNARGSHLISGDPGHESRAVCYLTWAFMLYVTSLIHLIEEILFFPFYKEGTETLSDLPKSTHWKKVEPGFGAQSIQL